MACSLGHDTDITSDQPTDGEFGEYDCEEVGRERDQDDIFELLKSKSYRAGISTHVHPRARIRMLS